MAKRGKFDLTQFLISLVFIALGLDSVIFALEALLRLDTAAIVASALGIFMFLVGILGVLRVNIKVCRVFAIIVCVLAGANFVMAALNLNFATISLVEALLAWVYFDIT